SPNGPRVIYIHDTSRLLAEVLAGETDQASPTKPMEKSYRGPLAELTAEQVRLRDARRADLEHLVGKNRRRAALHSSTRVLGHADLAERSEILCDLLVYFSGLGDHQRARVGERL